MSYIYHDDMLFYTQVSAISSPRVDDNDDSIDTEPTHNGGQLEEARVLHSSLRTVQKRAEIIRQERLKRNEMRLTNFKNQLVLSLVLRQQEAELKDHLRHRKELPQEYRGYSRYGGEVEKYDRSTEHWYRGVDMEKSHRENMRYQKVDHPLKVRTLIEVQDKIKCSTKIVQ